jgi:tetratricopeptide (TPR) repeat protein
LYRKNLRTLIDEWQTIVVSTEVASRDLQKAAYLFKRSPLFGKECARVIANFNVHTRELINQKEYPEALGNAEWSIRLSRSADAVFQKSIILFRLGNYGQAIDFMQRQLADSAMRSTLLPLRLTLGDSYWGSNDFGSAEFEYKELLADSLSLSVNEAAALRLQIFSDSTARRLFKPYFLAERSDSERVAFLESLKQFPSTDVLARYLLGREYSIKENDPKVVLELRVLSPMNSPILEFLRDRRLARAMYNMGNLELAKMYSWRALNYAANEAQLYQLEDFLQRCTWIQEHLQ